MGIVSSHHNRTMQGWLKGKAHPSIERSAYLLIPNAASLGFAQRINTGASAATPAIPSFFGSVSPVAI
jgi:hypothetical protein